MSHPFSPQVDAFNSVVLHCVELNDFENNCYLVVDVASGQTLLVDAADNAPAIIELVQVAAEHAAAAGTAEPQVAGILTTHRHRDHWQALAEVKDHYGVPSYAGSADADEIPGTTEHELHHGDSITLGETTLDIIGLRGHTAGSIAVAVTDPEHPTRLITGDSLFPGGPGKTVSHAEFGQLMDDLELRVFGVYGDDAVVYPGHGKPTTLGAERPHLAEWRARGW